MIPFCVIGVLSARCAREAAGPPSAPVVSHVAVVANPHNSLSTKTSFYVTGADSARLLYWADGESPSATPFYRVQGESASIAALGMRPATTYNHAVQVVGPSASVTSETVRLATGDLPPGLRDMHLDITGPSPAGYFVLAVSPPSPDTETYVVALDGSGVIRWYRGFGGGKGIGEAKQQENGNFTVFLGATQGWQPTFGEYVEFQPDGEVVHSYAASPPFYTDNHEMLLTGDAESVEAIHIVGYEVRRADLSFLGGPADALVAGHVLLRQAITGRVEFFWNAWDHFALQDWIEPTGVNPPLDFDHPNSLDFDRDGNYVVSFRHMGAIVKLDARTGAIIWQLGGRSNQFTILNDPLAGFSAQHCVRVLANGDLLVYDNGLRHTPPESRAVVYHLDQQGKTATVVWQYRHTPPLFTPFAGSVQPYENGNVLVGFSTAGVVAEVDPTGTALWEGTMTTGYFYRVILVPSLYRYERP